MDTKKAAVGKAFKSYYITVILLLFFCGFFMGWYYNSSTLDNSRLLLEKSKLNVNNFNYALLFSEKLNVSLCDSKMIDHMEEILFESGQELISLENSFDDDSEEYVLLKQKHNINQVLFYTYYRDYYLNCNNSKDIILFFFEGDGQQASKMQGEVLTSIVKDFDVRVVAMDYNFTKNLDFFYDFYQTEDLPSLVINYDSQVNGYTSYEELREYFQEDYE